MYYMLNYFFIHFKSCDMQAKLVGRGLKYLRLEYDAIE
jgi:hypothetical protein